MWVQTRTPKVMHRTVCYKAQPRNGGVTLRDLVLHTQHNTCSEEAFRTPRARSRKQHVAHVSNPVLPMLVRSKL